MVLDLYAGEFGVGGSPQVFLNILYATINRIVILFGGGFSLQKYISACLCQPNPPQMLINK